jgi:DNA-binding NarL/FixJ family response regulator
VISVLVVDDHPVVRAGLANLLRIEDDIDQVTAVSTCAEAEAEFDRRQPDVIVVDYRLPDGDGLTLCRALDQRDWPARVLIFSGYDPQQLIVAAAVAGAMGVLSKERRAMRSSVPSATWRRAVRRASRSSRRTSAARRNGSIPKTCPYSACGSRPARRWRSPT